MKHFSPNRNGARLIGSFAPATGCCGMRETVMVSFHGRVPLYFRGVAGKFSPTGAGEGIRTLDPDLGKVVLYP